ncbi:MAG TPA: MBL fold metallo-hydrolase [Candidatus Monoglobus merdigallinarum]|uniref:MBL fold metallo-hydrolase n=1 Tax=Candidatus Monoglobus merdigallinarum TaxID=2838698 RepID=A0A9D1PQY4_9FIRM|nr:MBL fold metallo-hydrolase [Candidatus Monoglobus merdigallinarum]
MELYPLKSGSKGNSCLVYTKNTKILVDCGISGKAASDALSQIGVAPDELSGIVVTHEHTDHIKGVGILARRYKLPVYANAKTWEAMRGSIGKISDSCVKVFDGVSSFSVGDLGIKPFDIPHDAAMPVGYCFDDGIERGAVATDMGVLTEEVMRAIGGCKTVLLESNHDINMLETGSYPYSLKQRIKGSLGHLSNDTAAKGAELLVKMGAERIILGHLSEENNFPALAYETVKSALACSGIVAGRDIALSVAV